MNEDYIWRDSRDEKPDNLRTVITCYYTSQSVDAGYYSSWSRLWSDVNGDTIDTPDFWSELPKPPTLREGYFDE